MADDKLDAARDRVLRIAAKGMNEQASKEDIQSAIYRVAQRLYDEGRLQEEVPNFEVIRMLFAELRIEMPREIVRLMLKGHTEGGSE